MANMDGYDAMALPYMGSPLPAISHGDFMAPMAPMEMPQPSPYDETFPRYSSIFYAISMLYASMMADYVVRTR